MALIVLFAAQVSAHGEYMALLMNGEKEDIGYDSGNVCTFALAKKQGKEPMNGCLSTGAEWCAADDNRQGSIERTGGECQAGTKGLFPTNGECVFDMAKIKTVVTLAGPGGSFGKKIHPPPYDNTIYQKVWQAYDKYGLHGGQDGIWHSSATCYLCFSRPENAMEPFKKNSPFNGGNYRQVNVAEWMEDESHREAGCEYMVKMTNPAPSPTALEHENVKTEFDMTELWRKHGDKLQSKTWVLKMIHIWADKPSDKYETYTRCMTVSFGTYNGEGAGDGKGAGDGEGAGDGVDVVSWLVPVAVVILLGVGVYIYVRYTKGASGDVKDGDVVGRQPAAGGRRNGKKPATPEAKRMQSSGKDDKLEGRDRLGKRRRTHKNTSTGEHGPVERNNQRGGNSSGSKPSKSRSKSRRVAE